MKALTQIAFLLLFLGSSSIAAQFGNGNRFGRQGRSSIPQAQTPQKEPEAKTAEQVVDEFMPKMIEALELDPFEEAVVKSTFVKYVQKRMELQILKLEPQKMKEEYEKLAKLQDQELKAGLPEDKYDKYLELQKNQFKAKKKKKKKKKKSKS
jgi:hypothetical protein